MSKPIDEILASKPEARPRIYAYSIADRAHAGLLKIGQTTRNVKQRIAEQLKTAAIKNYTIELDESAECDDGTIFSDHEVRAALVKKNGANPELEWMRCSLKDVKTVLTELRTGQRFTGTHHQTFPMRREQAEAVKLTVQRRGLVQTRSGATNRYSRAAFVTGLETCACRGMKAEHSGLDRSRLAAYCGEGNLQP